MVRIGGQGKSGTQKDQTLITLQDGTGRDHMPETKDAGPGDKLAYGKNIWGVFNAYTIASSSMGLFVFVYSLIILDLGGDAVSVGIVFSVSLIVATLSYLPGAILVHKVRRKPIMILSIAIPTISIVILYFATSWLHVLVAEAIWWFGTGIGGPAFITYITEASPKERVMSSFGFVYAGPAVAYIIAPLVGAFVIYIWDMRTIFLFALALRISAPLFLLFIDDQVPSTSKESARAILGRLFQVDRKMIWTILLFVLIAAVLSMCQPYLPVLLSEERDFNEVQVNILGSVGYLGTAFLSITIGFLGDRKGGTMAVAAVISVFIVGCVLLLGLHPLAGIIVSVFLMGIMWGAITVLDPIMSVKVPEDSRGGHLSIYLIAESLAMAPMPFIGGMLYDGVSPDAPFFVSAVAAAALLIVVLLRRDMTSAVNDTSSSH